MRRAGKARSTAAEAQASTTQYSHQLDHSTAWPSAAQHGTARHSMAQHGTARHGTARHGMAQYGTVHSHIDIHTGTQ